MKMDDRKKRVTVPFKTGQSQKRLPCTTRPQAVGRSAPIRKGTGAADGNDKRKLRGPIACALAAAVLAGSLHPGTAHAAVSSKNAPRRSVVNIKDTSKDPLSGYYIVYEINGHEYRSDRVGKRCNQIVWDKLSDEQRKKLVTDFAFAPSELKAQFGEEKTSEMMQWYEDYSGLTEARQILKDRIAQREFPKLSYFYGESYQQRSQVTLQETGYDLTRYKFLPEVREFYSLDSKMQACYDTGRSSYSVLVNAKTGQISTAVKGLSAVIIKQLICDRVLVPAISPGGLSALVPEIKTELWGIYDNLVHDSDAVYKMCGLGEWPDGKSARKIIDQYWKIINANERYTNLCVDKFLELKARKETVHREAVAAIEKYEEEGRKKADELRSDLLEAAKDQDLIMPDVDMVKREEETYEQWRTRVLGELDAEFEKFKKEYRDWDTEAREKAREMADKRNEILSGYGTFQSDAYPSAIVSYVNGSDRGGLLTADQYRASKEKMPQAFSEARAQVTEYLNRLTDYRGSYDDMMEGYTSAWTTFAKKLQGFKEVYARLEARCDYSLVHNTALDGTGRDYTTLTDIYDRCGTYLMRGEDGTDYRITLEEAGKQIQEQEQVLAERERAWEEQVEAYEKRMERVTREYEAAVRLAEEAQEAYEREQERARSVKEASDELYFYPVDQYSYEDSLHSEELQAAFDSLKGDGGALAALCDGWGADLSDKLETWQTGMIRRNEAQNDLIRAKHMADATLRTLTGTSADFNAVVDHMNSFSGKTLKYYDEVSPSYGPGSSTEYARSSPEGAGSMYYSYAQFADSNVMAFEHDMYYASVLQQKPNYMRGNIAGTSLLSPYHDGSGPLLKEPDVIPQYGLYSTKYKYTSRLWVGLGTAPGVKGEAKTMELLDKDVRGSWSWELAHGYVAVEGLAFTDPELQAAGLGMETGEQKDLNALVRVLPREASDQVLFWESDNTDVISVDESGIGTAVGDGTAILTVRARDSAWVENEDGTITYTPAPLTLTVTVGSGAVSRPYWNTDSTWKNYGTEEAPKLYEVRMIAGDMARVTCAVSSVTAEEAHIAVALYDDDGTMLDARLLPYTYEPGFRTVSLTADAARGLNIKAFALRADETLSPLDGTMLIDEKVR